MLRPTGHFWQERVRRVNDYERATFTATVTAAYSDAVYDVEVSATGARFYDVNNGTPYAFSVGDVVVVARLGGGRGNRHVIVAPAGRGNLAVTPGGGGGGSSGQTQSLSEVVKARSSDIYGAKPDLDARIECVDAEVALARHGAANLSAFLDHPTVESVTIHDGAKIITFDDGHLTFTDGVTGTRTLSQLAEAGAGDHDILSPTHPDTTPASLSSGDLLAAGADAKLTRLAAGAAGHVVRVVNGAPKYTPSLDSLCEQMLNLVLTNQLTTGNAVQAAVTYQFTNAATANNGIAVWSGAGWASSAWDRATSTAGNYMEIVFVGSQIVLWENTTHLRYGAVGHIASVLLDGVAQSDWNQGQGGSASYTISSLSYGVHVVRVTQKTDEIRVGEAVITQLPYQGVGVSGDTVALEYVSPWLYATTVGTAATDSGGLYPTSTYGETVLPRLPASTNMANDRYCTRAALDIDQGVAFAFLRMPIVMPFNASGVALGVAATYQPYPRPGLTIAAGSGGATRGVRPAADYWEAFGRLLVATQIHACFQAHVGRVTAPGAGSVLTAGDLVLVVTWSGLTTAGTGNRAYCSNDANSAMDFFVIPSALL